MSVAHAATRTTAAIGYASGDERSAPVAAASALTGLGRNGLRHLFGVRPQRPVAVRRQAQVGEEARHHDPLAELAEPRLGTLTARQRERELGISPAGSEREREAAAEARVDVGDEVRSIGLTEALDVRRAHELQLLRDLAGERDQPLVANRHPFDRLAAL